MIDGLRLAKVAAVHPEAYACDLVFLDDGSQIPLVQVMAGAASTNTGLRDLPEPSLPPSGDKWDLTDSLKRDMVAVVGFFRGLPIVLGFLFPQIGQMRFADVNRRVDRHASDVYTTVDDAGNVEVAHPSGTYIRIGATPEHDDLTGKDFDEQWAIERNTDAAVHLHVSVANAGTEVASLDIDPDGNVSLAHDGNLVTDTGGDMTATVAGNLSATIGGTTAVESTGDATVTAPNVTVDADQTTFTGAVTVQGPLTYQDGMTGTGGASITGDVTADGISLKAHQHSGVTTGTGTSGPPVP